MLNDIAVSVRGISKSYTISHDGEKPRTLVEATLRWVKNPLRRPATETFWALRDVSFEIQKGDVVGIIGRNGAGKSTMLKILSRITEPTTGEIHVHGRIGSLLEVGTGFHPDLTGRENVFLNGAILGMSKAEIRRQFDAIVDFAGVSRFLDTPVKRYSSGMYVRLAFAVAAHLRTDVLIVDEVLSVGDTEFQKKCMDKIESVGSSGRTVLFVSHSMTALLRLCKRGILLKSGQVAFAGSVSECSQAYLKMTGGETGAKTWAANDAPGDDVARLRSVRVLNSAGEDAPEVPSDHDFSIEVVYDQLKDNLERPLVAAFSVLSEGGVMVFTAHDFVNVEWYKSLRRAGTYYARCKVPANLLAEGSFTVLAAICSYIPNVVHAIERDAVRFQIADGETAKLVRGDYSGEWPGVIRPILEWNVHRA